MDLSFTLCRICLIETHLFTVMAGLDPAIHAQAIGRKTTWMTGSSPIMTGELCHKQRTSVP
jgi:hypothetical protein